MDSLKKKIWTHSDLMEETCERATKALKDLLPLVDYDIEMLTTDKNGDVRLKDTYQDIFNGFYDTIEDTIIDILTKESENNWFELDFFTWEGSYDVIYRKLDELKYIVCDVENNKQATIDLEEVTLGFANNAVESFNFELPYVVSEGGYLALAILIFAYINK